MKEPIVVDSTCLIGLERIGRLELLPAVYEPVIAPPAVREEFGRDLPWLRVEAPAGEGLVKALQLLVDDGESEAIALARERKWRLLVDDRQARLVAKRMGVRIIGTVGILVRAKQQGLIPALRPVLEALERAGFYIGAELKREALRLADE